jgi:hypothetical protein
LHNRVLCGWKRTNVAQPRMPFRRNLRGMVVVLLDQGKRMREIRKGAVNTIARISSEYCPNDNHRVEANLSKVNPAMTAYS